MAKRIKLFGITYLVGNLKFKLLFHGPLAEQDPGLLVLWYWGSWGAWDDVFSY